MFIAESDKSSGRLAPDAPAAVGLNANNAINQFSIETDATLGTLTFTVTPRKKSTPEPLYESDGATQVVIDLANARRTVIAVGAFKEVQIVAAGMNGNFYELIASGGDA